MRWVLTTEEQVAMAKTDLLLTELENRERAGPGQWTGEQCRRIKVLSEKLNPEPINP